MTTIIATNPTTTGTRKNDKEMTTTTSSCELQRESCVSSKKRVTTSDNPRTAVPNDNTSTFLSSDTHSESRIQFFMVHFNILQALYRKESPNASDPSLLPRHNDVTDDDDADVEDEPHSPQQQQQQQQQCDLQSPINFHSNKNDSVPMIMWNSNNLWLHIRSFMMHQREFLLHIQQRIEYISHLHEAALECCPNTTTTTPRSTTPHHHDPTTTNDSSFRIIANLIGQHSKTIRQQKQVPSIVMIQQLLHEVIRRIESLRADADAMDDTKRPSYLIQNHNGRENEERGNSTTPKGFQTSLRSQYDDRSYRMEIRYKIQLWSLLAHDLKEVLRN